MPKSAIIVGTQIPGSGIVKLNLEWLGKVSIN